jgi:dienelactone hydrolase
VLEIIIFFTTNWERNMKSNGGQFNIYKNGFGWILLLTIIFLSGCGNNIRIKSFAPTPERGENISGVITKPDGEGPFPAVVILHGCSGVNDHDYQWARRFKSWGYASLILDSHNPRGISNNCGKRRVTPLERALDAHAAKTQFGEMPFVDRDRIGVIGFSEGGGTVLEAINFNLVEFTLPPGSNDPFKAAVAFYPYCRYRADSNTNLLILIGGKDDWTPASVCEENLPIAHFPDNEIILKVYPNAVHSFDYDKPYRNYMGHALGYSSSAMTDAVPRVKAFFDKSL